MSILLDDDEIYSAVTHGFGRKVKAGNLTDEIALKRHESAKQVANDQAKKFVDIIKSDYPETLFLLEDLKFWHELLKEIE